MYIPLSLPSPFGPGFSSTSPDSNNDITLEIIIQHLHTYPNEIYITFRYISM